MNLHLADMAPLKAVVDILGYRDGRAEKGKSWSLRCGLLIKVIKATFFSENNPYFFHQWVPLVTVIFNKRTVKTGRKKFELFPPLPQHELS